jgi:hypothetical protein
MATPTPNVSQEQTNKASLRAQTRAGVTPANPNPPVDEAFLVNAFAQASGILRLTGVLSTSKFTISGTGTGVNSTTVTGSTGKVSDLVSALATGPLKSSTFFVNAGPAQLLKGNTGSSDGGAVVDIIVPSGINLTVVNNGGTGTPTLTAVSITGALGTSYPNYVGTPNATPNWIDDVTVHTYTVGFGGMISNSTILTGGTTVTTTGTITAQQQVRQISTQISETQEYDGYFATYVGNLYQTTQKRTYRQQN